MRILLIDDEPASRQFLRLALADDPAMSVVGEAGTINEARVQLARTDYDLVLLDIQLRGGTGFDLTPFVRPEARIVFVTAYDEHALRAFDVSAVDYVLKPVSPKRLAEALGRVRSGRAPVATEPGLPFVRAGTLILRDTDRVRRVSLVDIAAVRADGHYTRVLLAEEPAMFILKSIKEWALKLSATDFVQVDRSLIVNLSRVRSLETESRDVAKLTLKAIGKPITLGRAASARLRLALATP